MKLLYATLVFSVFGTGAIAGDISFPIQNNGAADLLSFEYRESGSNTWTDVLGSGTLPSGHSTTVILEDRDTCLFDIKAAFSDGSTINEPAVNLCENAGGFEF